MAGSVTVEEFAIPGSLDDMRSADFQAVVDVRNAIVREYMGDRADTTSIDEFFAGMLDQTDERHRTFIARHDDVPIAYAIISWSVEPDTRVSRRLRAPRVVQWFRAGASTGPTCQAR